MRSRRNVLFAMNYAPTVSYYWDTAELLYRKLTEALGPYGAEGFIAYPGGLASDRVAGDKAPLRVLWHDCKDVRPASLRALARLVKTCDIGLVLFADAPYVAAYYAAARAGGARAIWVYTHSSGEWPTPGRVRYGLKRVVFRLDPVFSPDLVLVPSAFARARTVDKAGFPSERTHLVYNGVDCRRFAPGNGHLRAGTPAARTVICCARATREKGIETLLEAATIVRARRADIEFRYVGDGPDLDDLKGRAAAQLPAGTFHFLGRRPDVDALLRQAHVSVVPSIWAENFPLAVLESLASGVPVVASRVGGIPEAVEHGHNGLLVAPGRPEELARAIDRVLSDGELARDLAANGRSTVVERFSLERQVAQLRLLAREALAV